MMETNVRKFCKIEKCFIFKLWVIDVFPTLIHEIKLKEIIKK